MAAMMHESIYINAIKNDI